MEQKPPAEPKKPKQPPEARPRPDWRALIRESIASSPKTNEMLARRR